MTYRLIQGDNREILKQFPDNHFDSIVTDPPYGIAFLGKSWDHKKATETTSKIAQLHNLPSGMKHTTLADDLEFQYWLRELWIECLRVLKPGGHLLAFSAARTYHHMAMSLQTAGFEIRDQIMWIYSSGFPKSQDIGKSIDRAAGKKDPNYGTTNNNGTLGGINLSFTEDHIGGSRRCRKCKRDVAAQYDCKEHECGLKYRAQTEEGKTWLGWGTALKPAHEPIALARKPIKTSIAKNVEKYGVGALNIDACRIPTDDLKPSKMTTSAHTNYNAEKNTVEGLTQGEELDWIPNEGGRFPSNVIGEIEEPYQKYFYCPKVSRAERHIGFDDAPDAQLILNEMQAYFIDDQGNKVAYEDRHNVGMVYIPHINTTIPFRHIYDEYTKWKKSNNNKIVGNNHPTVKPVALMEYLIKLITPPNGLVLDPFNGSGSTGMAAVGLGFDYVGIDLDPNYIEISKRRIEAWDQEQNPNLFRELFEDAVE